MSVGGVVPAHLLADPARRQAALVSCPEHVHHLPLALAEREFRDRVYSRLDRQVVVAGSPELLCVLHEREANRLGELRKRSLTHLYLLLQS